MCSSVAQLVCLLVSIVLLLSCTGDGVTEPEGLAVYIEGTLSNAAGKPTLILWQISYDERQASYPMRSDPPCSSTFIGGNVTNAFLKGHHTLRITVEEQTISPSRYSVHNLRVSVKKLQWSNTYPEVDLLQLPDKTELLSTGEGIVYSIDH